jgi:hypothetical protein
VREGAGDWAIRVESRARQSQRHMITFRHLRFAFSSTLTRPATAGPGRAFGGAVGHGTFG